MNGIVIPVGGIAAAAGMGIGGGGSGRISGIDGKAIPVEVKRMGFAGMGGLVIRDATAAGLELVISVEGGIDTPAGLGFVIRVEGGIDTPAGMGLVISVEGGREADGSWEIVNPAGFTGMDGGLVKIEECKIGGSRGEIGSGSVDGFSSVLDDG